ncbi:MULTISPECIES: 2-hydroxychromene-2-carboxylate isomerase [unclassified Janthinobacterium]|uniref:2-hydroxychromene-2-carboxylate isomerase n=1 Tax=unclassified Janthinobacterium TaxID=2610881 RepID=UPI00034A5034|nr:MULTISPECIES: 2-hydroxychromene-2-carboxylate isomerase [unclassified Janthinobacterium]MEC5159515.1 2-hydroxychromene-2-carboxylate isomerase [Janthinobacterium sp. CG_S6]
MQTNMQSNPQAAPAELEFWFDFGSNYSYLSVMRIEQLARQAGVTVLWRPFVLGPIFKAMGWDNSPFVLQKAKGNYMWRDMARQCDKYGVPWRQPSEFPRHSLLPVRVALYGEGEPWIAEFCRRVMLRNFSADLDINGADSVAAVLLQLGLDAAAIIDAAQADANKLRLKERTVRATSLGIFGAPTCFVGAEMYWGNDRLDDAVERARRAGESA